MYLDLYNEKLKQVDLLRLPNHIAFIMDGNRRWSKRNNLPSFVGHKKGFVNFKDIIFFSKELGIKELSFFAFSKENWNRSNEEVNFLLNLMLFYTNREIFRIIEEGIRIRIIGDKESIPVELKEAFNRIERESEIFDKMIVNVMINYSGQYDVLQAIKKIIHSGYGSEQVDYDLINSCLLISSPDLLIRTGGEYRISNFILFQLAYTELYFSQKMWPDFQIDDLIDAIIDYQGRERRWGK
ncbi:MAG: polyprenyl diphosphate synthase [bacterium]|nr:polyprenyl diphosphate synthase [bacterium]